MTIRIGLIGLGAIGGGVVKAVQDGKAGDARVVAVLVRDPGKYDELAKWGSFKLTADPEEFLSSEMDLVV